MPAPAEDQDQVATDDTAESAEKKSKKRPVGNREAVRKYREKKKARTASLEDEGVKLRALNQHLMKKLQGQAALEAEIARLQCLLVDIRGRIEGEIGSFPYQKSANSNLPIPNMPGSYVM
ncbi:bZIP transcription factor, partial [Escherichia coli]|nr:bZIP transcription factor [Escherichia coli]